MIVVRYAVCSERDGKPTMRAVVDSRPEADKLLEKLRQRELSSPEQQYWIAELGPECEAWRRLLGE